MTLTKAQIVESVQSQIGFPKNKSSEHIEILIETIKRTLASGEDVLFSGFGWFCVKEKNARKGRNPATGEDLMLKSRKVVALTILSTHPNDGIIRTRPEVKGRKGKTVTAVFGVPLDDKKLRQLAKTLKRFCGTGGVL